MNRKSLGLWLLITVAAVQPALAEPLAVRVEVEVLGRASGGARVAVTVQVSPEDRGRIGANAMLQVELDGEAPPGQSPMWAVRMEDDGSARIETVWPPGEHELQVRISSPNGRDSGLWVGAVRIPGPGAAPLEPTSAPVAPPPAPEPQAAPAGDVRGASLDGPMVPPPAAADAVEIVPPAPEPATVAEAGPAREVAARLDPLAAEQPFPEGEAAAGDPLEEPADAVQASAAEPVPVEDAAEPMTAAAAQEEAAMPVADAASGEEAAEVMTEAVPLEKAVEAAVEAVPVEEGAPPAAEKASSGEAVGPIAEPVVEPLRGKPATSAGPPTPAAQAEPPPPPPAIAAAHAAWTGSDSATSELTAVVLRGREPVRGLQPDDLLLRVGGVEVPIEELGGALEAPLLLGIAVDAAADSGFGWPRDGELASLTARAGEGLGSSFYAASGGWLGEWGEEPPAAAPGGPGGDVASLVVDALRRFDGTRGRRFLLLVTDGRNEPDKETWRAAVIAAGEAGTPVLVVVLWDEGFSRRTRNNLREIAEVSGGSLFLVQGETQLDRAAERFGPLLDAGVAVRFEVPAGVDLPAEVRLEGVERGLEVATAERLR